MEASTGPKGKVSSHSMFGEIPKSKPVALIGLASKTGKTSLSLTFQSALKTFSDSLIPSGKSFETAACLSKLVSPYTTAAGLFVSNQKKVHSQKRFPFPHF